MISTIFDIVFSDPHLKCCTKPFNGEGSAANPADFSGRCLLLRGNWIATLPDESQVAAQPLMGDWPLLELPTVLALKPSNGAIGYEIGSQTLNRYLFSSCNALENYTIFMQKKGIAVSNDGKALGKGDRLLIGVDLTDIKKSEQKRALCEKVLSWCGEHGEGLTMIYEFLGPKQPQNQSFFEGRLDIKGESIVGVGSILHHQESIKITGLPLQWHLRKIPGWPLALQEGPPALCARVEDISQWRVLYLLHRLYGRRFKVSIVFFYEKEMLDFWRFALHRIWKPNTLINKKIKVSAGADYSARYQDDFLWLPVNSSDVVLLIDYLWKNDEIPLESKQSVAAYGWYFCYLVLSFLKLEKKIWTPFFKKLSILGKLPLQFPTDDFYDQKKWLKIWQRIIGKTRLEELDLKVWTFYPPVVQWQMQGSLAELLAFHSILPLRQSMDASLEKAIAITPLFWQKEFKKVQLGNPKKVASWPIWERLFSNYVRQQNEYMMQF